MLLFKWKYLNSIYKAVLLFLVSWFAAGITSWLTALYIGRNDFTTHITSFIMAAAVFYLLAELRDKREALLAAAFYMITLAADVLFISEGGYNWFSRIYLVLVFSVLFAKVLNKLQSGQGPLQMHEQPLYWIAGGILFYYSVTFSLDIGFQLSSSTPVLVKFHMARIITGILAQISLLIGIAKIPRNHNFNLK